MARKMEPADYSEPADEEEFQLIDLTRPIRRDVIDRPPQYQLRPKHLSIAEIRLAEHRLNCSAFPSGGVMGLLIGENPGRNTHPDMPLFPSPKTSAAGRLLAMSGMTAGEYLGYLYRRNLCDAEWDQSAAERRARLIVTALFDLPKSLRVILLGQRVMSAFQRAENRTDVKFWRSFRLESGQLAACIPHPSGKNLLYNELANRELAGRWMRWAAIGEEMPSE